MKNDIMSMDLDRITSQQEAEAWRNIANQLAAALQIAKGSMHEDGMQILIRAPHDQEFTSGHAINGALAMHDWGRRNISPPF